MTAGTAVRPVAAPRAGLPLELVHIHRGMEPGEQVALHISAVAAEPAWETDRLGDVLVGGGFAVDEMSARRGGWQATVTRLRSLPDTVAAGMRLLVCGLNPSEYAADRGVGYARPGNRFWPAALEAGLVTRSHDPLHALLDHGVGMTDLVKRATTQASLLAEDEYRAGTARVERLVAWLRPAAVCIVGLAGWRSAVDRHAVPGPQPNPFGGRPVYLMPSTSGLNAHSSQAELAQHLRAAAALGRDKRA